MKLAFVRLLVDDFPACFRFYRDVMGFTPTFGEENDVYADFDAGEVTIALFNRRLMAEAIGRVIAPSGGEISRAVLVFSVDDVDGELSRLRQTGAAIVAEPADRPGWSIRTAHIEDPAGNVIEFFRPLEREG